MDTNSCFACLGRPLLRDLNGDPVPVKTRKALAIIGYLSRRADLAAPRAKIADILWSQADRQKAMQSLRQALRQLKSAEGLAGHEIVTSTSSTIQLNRAVFHSDLDALLLLLQNGKPTDFEKAVGLWRGEYLAGYEDLDQEFTEWLLVERERVQSEVVTETFKHLKSGAVDAAQDHVESAAHFLLHIDPALEAAHQVLIRYYMALGQNERAEQQLKTCEREMKLHFDAAPSVATMALLQKTSLVQRKPASEQLEASRKSLELQRPEDEPETIKLPSITVSFAQLDKKGLDDAVNLKDEILAGLSSYRSFDLFHSEYFEAGEGPKPVLLDSNGLGSYMLRFHYNERSEKVSVQFEDRSDGRIVFNEIVDLRQWDNIPAAASQTTNHIYMQVIGRLRNPKNSSAFAKWCQAESLMWHFDPQSDVKALQILNDLESQFKNFSMIFASKAMINLKQLVCYPIDERGLDLSFNDILSLCEKAIVLDPWQPFNQRSHGWALIQSGMAVEAKKAFLNAARLNSVDPINLMSVAEGLAYAGDVERAREKADLAIDLFNSVPRIFYEYYSSVHFAAEDFEAAASMVERAQFTSVSPLTTRIAALVCMGKEKEALDVLKRHRDSYAYTIQKTGLRQDSLEEWSQRVNFFQEPKTRANYEKGVDLVRRFFFA